MQVGYGVWYGEGLERNFYSSVPAHERQSVRRGELQGVPHALLQRQESETLVIIMDSEYVYKGIVEWSPKWWRQGWHCSTGDVRHHDLWEQILWLREAGVGQSAVAVGSVTSRSTW